MKTEIKIHPPERILKATFLVAAFASFLLSVSLYFLADNKEQGIFVGLWVPSILSLGSFLLARSDRS